MVHFIVVDKTKLSIIFGLLIASFEVHTDWLAPEIVLIKSRCIESLSGSNKLKSSKMDLIFLWNYRNLNQNIRYSTGSGLLSSNILLLHRKFISNQKTNFISANCPNKNKEWNAKNKPDLLRHFLPVRCVAPEKMQTKKIVDEIAQLNSDKLQIRSWYKLFACIFFFSLTFGSGEINCILRIGKFTGECDIFFSLAQIDGNSIVEYDQQRKKQETKVKTNIVRIFGTLIFVFGRECFYHSIWRAVLTVIKSTCNQIKSE